MYVSMIVMLVGLLRERARDLGKNARERGAGGNTLEILLLAVGGVIVAALVVIAVKAAVDGKTDELTDKSK